MSWVGPKKNMVSLVMPQKGWNRVVLTFKLASSYKNCTRPLRTKDRRHVVEELRAIPSINAKPPARRILARFTDSAHRWHSASTISARNPVRSGETYKLCSRLANTTSVRRVTIRRGRKCATHSQLSWASSSQSVRFRHRYDFPHTFETNS
jgi:hypothetical protein